MLLLINLLSVSAKNSLDKTLHTLTKQSSNENEVSELQDIPHFAQVHSLQSAVLPRLLQRELKGDLDGGRSYMVTPQGREHYVQGTYIRTQQNIHNLMHDHYLLAVLLALNVTATSYHPFQAKLLLLLYA